MKKSFNIVLISLLAVFSFGQKVYLPVDERFDEVLAFLMTKDTVYRYSFKPFLVVDDKNLRWSKTIWDYLNFKLVDRIFLSDNFEVKDKDLMFRLNLLGQLYWGQVENDTFPYTRNTRGFEIYGNVGNSIFFYTKFLENQTFFPDYLDKYIEENLVVPGEGWWKPFGDKGRDYLYAQGFVAFELSKKLMFEIGNSKHFIGNGYRSLLLSDNSFNYPYFKLKFDFGRWQLINIWAELYQFKIRYYFYHYPKSATFTIVNYANKFIDFNLFQGVIWQTSDYKTYIRRYPLGFFIPIFVGFYGLDNKHNLLYGVDLSLRYKTYLVYGQFVLDDFVFGKPMNYYRDRYGWQVGVRSYDVFMGHIEFLRLGYLVEYNFVRPYTYQSRYLYQGYFHYNQPLAHPAGAGFKELVIGGKVSLLNFSFDYKKIKLVQSYSSVGDAGNNPVNQLLEPYEYSFVGYPGQRELFYEVIRLSFLLNSRSHLRIFWEQIKRVDNLDGQLVYTIFGISTNIGRFYYDF